MGSPFSATDMTPVYGAIGTAATTPTQADIQLGTEAARVIVVASGSVPATSSANAALILSFLFPLPASTITVSEAGVFVSASSTANAGWLLDHSLISPTVAQTTTQLLTMNVTLSIGL